MKQSKTHSLTKWSDYLQDTRNEMGTYLLLPIENILETKTISAEQKNKMIKDVVYDFKNRMKKWNVNNYGIFIP